MNGTEAEVKKKKRSRYGIKWKMYAVLVLFLFFTIIVIWFFNVQLLSYFYQSSKLNELENTALLITQALQSADNEVTNDITSEQSQAYTADIWVCKLRSDGGFSTVSLAHATNSPTRNIIVSNFSTLYRMTTDNNGNYIALIPGHMPQNSDKLVVIDDNIGSPGNFPYKINSTDRMRVVYVSVKTVRGDAYMIVQSTGLTPLASITSTMKNQFLCIGVILSIAALIVATVMTKIITKPIEKMNNSAKRLAQGEYGADFTVSGYKEIDELADTLNYASHELAKTDKLQKELISNVSHDLRTPLTMIKGYSEVMRDIPGENTPENVQIIIDETTRLSELVNDMLDLSKIQSGTRKAEMQSFSLTATVRDTLRRYERLIMQDGYSIDFVYDNEINVYADRGMILQVVYNLINNAINYTGENKTVIVNQDVRENKVRISVTDTGDGIAEDELNAIWDRYYKVDKVHKRATVGTGLGLSIVKGVLDIHKATYGVESQIGNGSTFWFELNIYEKNNKIINSDYIEADYEEQDKI